MAGLTSFLFKAARASADLRAVSNGPGAISRRAARKTIRRAVGGKSKGWL